MMGIIPEGTVPCFFSLLESILEDKWKMEEEGVKRNRRCDEDEKEQLKEDGIRGVKHSLQEERRITKLMFPRN